MRLNFCYLLKKYINILLFVWLGFPLIWRMAQYVKPNKAYMIWAFLSFGVAFFREPQKGFISRNKM